MGKKLSVLGAVLLGGYLILTFLIIFNQRSLIYQPNASGHLTPRNFGVDFEEVHFRNAEELTLHGWWVSQIGSSAVHPTVVYCHGNGGSLSDLAETASIFYRLEWNSFFFDYRGYGTSEASPHGMSEEGLVEDAQAAYRWVEGRAASDDKIFIWGHSLGSAVAAHLASRTSPAGLILEDTFPSTYAMARYRYPWAAIFPFMIVDRFETSRYLEKRKFPVLIMHAERDTVVPLPLGRSVYEGTPEPKKWMLLEEIGHVDLPRVFGRYEERLKEFISISH